MEKLFKSPILFAFVRVIFYSLFLVLASYMVYLDSMILRETGKFMEDSFTEWTQEIILLLAAVMYFISGRIDRKTTGFTGMMSGMCVIALIREYNNYFHSWFRGAWQMWVIVALIIFGVYIYKNRKTFTAPFREFLKHPSFGVNLSAFVTIVVFSRLFGRKVIWENILEVDVLVDQYRWVKNAAEEGTELMGYALLFIAAVEYFIYILAKKKIPEEYMRTE